MSSDPDERRWRKTKAVVKRSGQRVKRRELKIELARDPESVDQFDRYQFERSDSSRAFADARRGRPENTGRPE